MAGDDVILSFRPATSAFTLDSLHSLIQADLAQVQKCSSATPKKSRKSGDDIIRELRQNRKAKEKLTENNFLSHPFAAEYDSEDDDDILPKRSDSFSLLIHSELWADFVHYPEYIHRKLLSMSSNSSHNPSNRPVNSNNTQLSRQTRKSLKKSHIPSGLVAFFESMVATFLENPEINLTSNHCLSPSNAEFSDINYSYQVRLMNILNEDSQSLKKNQRSKLKISKNELDGLEKNDDVEYVMYWKIQDEFHRMILHSIARYYGCVSYSKPTKGNPQSNNGYRTLKETFVHHPCRYQPNFELNREMLPGKSFHHFLFGREYDAFA
ncbi:hypothetical protein BKA69DRAFT_1120907 [Paraphysoderma sedebokerense]|nr:hypothetical protein BKA69DRAFT_1120907 [Paraphysoderma sedebokerense]